MEFIATFNTILIILYRPVLLVEETEVHRPAVSHWQTLSHNVVSSWVEFVPTKLVAICTDCTGSCKSNYHTTTTAHHESFNSDDGQQFYLYQQHEQSPLISMHWKQIHIRPSRHLVLEIQVIDEHQLIAHELNNIFFLSPELKKHASTTCAMNVPGDSEKMFADSNVEIRSSKLQEDRKL